MELAEKLGISHPFVSQIENGIRTPSIKMQAQINRLIIEESITSDFENTTKIANIESRIEELEKKIQEYKEQNQLLIEKLSSLSVVDNRQNRQ